MSKLLADNILTSLKSKIQGMIDAAVNNAIVNRIYPVGSIFMSSDLSTPQQVANLLGGTWVRYSPGTTLIGYLESDSNFNEVNKIGGSKTHTLTINEMPAHTHTMTRMWTQNYNGTAAIDLSSTLVHLQYDNVGTTSSTGGSQAFSILPPYQVVYIYKRTH